MSNYSGVWQVTQAWQGTTPYTFNMTITDTGLITIEGGFSGIIAELGASSFLSMAISNTQAQSITAYVGNIVGPVMGGVMTGTQGGQVFQGTWSAALESNANAPKKVCGVGK